MSFKTQKSIKRLCVVIVNYKTPDLTMNCIESLRCQLDASKDHIVVVDNNSGGPDVARMDSYIEANGLSNLVTLAQSHENNGFSAGNNIGIKAIEAKYYLLANSDTIFRNKAILELLKAKETYPHAGVISPRLEWKDGEPQISCFKFHTPIYEFIKSAGTNLLTHIFTQFNVPLRVVDKVTKPDWTSFACVLIKQDVVKTIGYLDDSFFMFFEDVDYCRRAKRAGFEIVNWPWAHVVHLRGQSSVVKKNERQRKRLPQYFYNSRARYYTKYYGRLGFLCSNLCWLSGRSISLLKEIAFHKNRTLPAYQWIDIWKKEK